MSTKKVDFKSNEFRFRFFMASASDFKFLCFPFQLKKEKMNYYRSAKKSVKLHAALANAPGHFFFTVSLSLLHFPRTHSHSRTLSFSFSLSLVCVRYFFFQHSNTPTRTHQCINTHHWTFNWLHSITISRSVPFPSFSQPVLCLRLSSLSPFLTH